MYVFTMIVEWAALTVAVVGTLLVLTAVLRRLGIIRARFPISILRAPVGFRSDGGRSIEAMERRWEIYEAIGTVLAYLVYYFTQYEVNRLFPR